MPNAPYTDPPIDPKVKDAADGIYFGWMGLAQDATFRANMAAILTDGIVAALTDPAVIAANAQAIEEGIVAAINDPQLATDLAAIIGEGVESGIIDSVVELVNTDVIPDKAAWGRAFVLVALACTSVRRSGFMEATDQDSFDQLRARVNETEIEVLQP